MRSTLRGCLGGLWLLPLAVAAGCGHDDPPPDILVRLQALPGVTVTEQAPPKSVEGYRAFRLLVDQPTDHTHPEGQRFQQRVMLLHRDAAAPMVLYSTGYFSGTNPGRSEIAQLFDANQLVVEHRYFGTSRPDPVDWTRLDIAQAAADHHDIVQRLKPIYGARWISAGGSKGGMTSIFHRRFFPDDVDGTVAYVAPLDYPEDQVAGPGNRYIAFLAAIGDADCRARLHSFQKEVLSRRDQLLPMLAAAARAKNTHFDVLGLEPALEYMTEEMPFIFWQYGSADNCKRIPDSQATDETIYQFLDDTVDALSYADADIDDYLPYYYQCANQLGYPADDESDLTLKYRGGDTAAAYLPPGVPRPVYDQGASMRDIQGWVRSEGNRLLLIYGENDPWTAGAIDLGSARDSLRFTVHSGNHYSKIYALDGGDQMVALGALERWIGAKVVYYDPNTIKRGPESRRERVLEDSTRHHRGL